MNLEERFELIKRNTEEIVTEEELKKLLEEKKTPIVYHGFEPSGDGLHIGTVIGINKHIDFQKAGLKLKILFADLHAWLNEKGSLSKIEHISELYKEGLIAFGVDAKKTDFICGSDFQLGHEFFLDVLRLSLRTRLDRVRRSMTLVGRDEKDPHVAQIIYPLMQTIDGKHLGVDIAFGDLAQRKIHMLMRENLADLEFKTPIAIHHADMVGLTGGKMSSSIPNSRIMIDEPPENIKKKIRNAFCPFKQTKNNPILQICKYIIFPRRSKLKVERERKYGGEQEFESYEELERAFKSGLHPLDLKNAVAESLIKILEPVRKYMGKKKVRNIKELIKASV